MARNKALFMEKCVYYPFNCQENEIGDSTLDDIYSAAAGVHLGFGKNWWLF